MDWRTRARCRQVEGQPAPVDPELFFPTGTSGPALTQAAEAKRFCGDCPVREQCLRWALAVGVEGIWGGTTDDERRELRRAAAAQRATARAQHARDLAEQQAADPQPYRRQHGHCGTCACRQPLRNDGTIVSHARNARGELVPCGGAGTPAVAGPVKKRVDVGRVRKQIVAGR